jgi:hypothetical protein
MVTLEGDRRLQAGKAALRGCGEACDREDAAVNTANCLAELADLLTPQEQAQALSEALHLYDAALAIEADSSVRIRLVYFSFCMVAAFAAW